MKMAADAPEADFRGRLLKKSSNPPMHPGAAGDLGGFEIATS